MLKYCYECGERITFWKSRFHPVRGKKVLVCLHCFEVIQESLEKYQDFILNDLDHGMLKKETDFITNNLAFHNVQNHNKKPIH
ncbi:MAG: hypothetical protein KKC68_00140 [Candidatus Thermoplasmatota archaeon]|nr:hypothetical protein [Candidatus Thermoplasmatota archaeon]MBU1940161.1 hypothetical protein [Candidatus Thermoplasmatota archaeon]